ncbi:hypothetical protein SADUNF_Sadunf04G0010100 [Salix dunnii]|uniref:Cytochrome P450 n=1 Tax=Salix dunnii TaxID=1413687 RepID=A0A835N002_9ROSI|nr:hypothetical protein SADUNF_Sadunf04G0010100 [Salix dunnii]
MKTSSMHQSCKNSTENNVFNVNQRGKIRQIFEDLIRERKKAALEHGTAFPRQDLITTLVSLRNEENSAVLTDGEIIDNAIIIMVAGYDTTSILLSLLTRLLANDPSIYASILQDLRLQNKQGFPKDDRCSMIPSLHPLSLV